jgi:FkbM family methyltransferase
MSSYYQCLNQISFDSDYSPIFFDVGCNINATFEGCMLDDFTQIALQQYPNAKCYGLDPLYWQVYEEKWKNDPRVTVIKKALADSTENRILYTPGALNTINAHAISSFYNRKCFTRGIDQVEVECTTIDLLIDELNLDRIDYLKIDTEGAEFLILKGSSKSLSDKKINCIQLEHGGTFDDAGFTISDLTDYLAQYDYVEIFRTESELLFVNKENL